MLTEYAMRLDQFGDLACAHITFSPDSSYIAFTTLEKPTEHLNNADYVEVAYLFNRTAGSERRLYASKHGFLTEFQWSSDGYLILSDTNIDECGGDSLVFDPLEGKVLQTVKGVFRENSWNQSKTAAFFISHCWGDQPATDELAVYDFALKKTMPRLVHARELSGMRFTQGPTWFLGGTKLAITIREGEWENDFMDFPLT
ncbi:MAG: hypothetical protein WBZ24_15245, partial [Anaerolineales bacterium]